MLANHLNQTAQHSTRKLDESGKLILNLYGEPDYRVPVAIKVRKEEKVEEVLNSKGELVQSSTVYYAIVPIIPGDKLDNKLVVATKPFVGFGGRIYGFRCYV